MKVQIKKYDDLTIQIITDSRAYIAGIKDYFTDYVEGFRHMPKYKAGGWDGKISMLSLPNRTLPYGLLFDVIKFHKKTYNDVELEIDQDVKDFFVGRDVEIDYNLSKFPREYQIDCIETALKYNRGIIRVATAGGKSLLITYIIKYLMENTLISKALIIVPTQSLVEQFYKDMIEYGIEMFDLGRVYSKYKEFSKPIVISTWQSLSRNLDKMEDFECVICDEVHSAKAVEIRKILYTAKNATYRFGFTGTLPNSKLDLWNIKSYLGPVVREYGAAELAEQGFIAPCNVQYVVINYNNPEKYEGEYNDVKDKIFNNESRLRFIKDIVSSIDSNILLLVGKVEKEGQLLKEYLERANLKDREVVFLWGDTKVEERERWREECEKRKDIVLIATYGILQVGVNIPSLKYILFASPFKSKIRVLQSIGRALRTHETKIDGSTIYDIVDNVTYLGEHGIKRLRYYINEKFNVEERSFDELKLNYFK